MPGSSRSSMEREPAAPSLDALPNELLRLVLAPACEHGDGPALSRVNRRFHALAEPALYASVAIPSTHALALLVRTLEGRPALARHVRALALYTARVPFDVACRLARLLGAYEARLDCLKVRFPASDLPLALDFLESLSPRHFEWITSPTWVIRPGNLFQRFLTKWTRLTTLRLGNFYLDSVLAASIAALPHITHLTLLGQSNSNLEPAALRTLLEGTPLLTLLEVGDCPLRRRVIVEAELGIARASAADGLVGAGTRTRAPSSSDGRACPQAAPAASTFPRAGLSADYDDPVPPALTSALTLNHADAASPQTPTTATVLAPSSAPTQRLLRRPPLPAVHAHAHNVFAVHRPKLLAAAEAWHAHREALDPYAWHRRRIDVLRWVA